MHLFGWQLGCEWRSVPSSRYEVQRISAAELEAKSEASVISAQVEPKERDRERWIGGETERERERERDRQAERERARESELDPRCWGDLGPVYIPTYIRKYIHVCMSVCMYVCV